MEEVGGRRVLQAAAQLRFAANCKKSILAIFDTRGRRIWMGLLNGQSRSNTGAAPQTIF